MSESRFEPLCFAKKPAEEMVATAQWFYREMKRWRTVREFSGRLISAQHVISMGGDAPGC